DVFAPAVLRGDGGDAAAVHDVHALGAAGEATDAVPVFDARYRTGVVAGDDAGLGVGQIVGRRDPARQPADTGGTRDRAAVAAALDGDGVAALGLQGAGEATDLVRIRRRDRDGAAAVGDAAPGVAD